MANSSFRERMLSLRAAVINREVSRELVLREIDFLIKDYAGLGVNYGPMPEFIPEHESPISVRIAPENYGESRERHLSGETGNLTARHPSSQKFHDLLKKLGDLHDRKQQDYGSSTDPFMNIRASEELGISAIKGAQLRANDKTKRILRWLCGSTLSNEGVLDSLQDRMVYDGITIVLIEEAQEQGINVESMLNVNLQS